MSILKKGVTGFDKPMHIQEHSNIAIEDFVRCITHPFMKIGEILLPDGSSNYFRIHIVHKVQNKKFDILLNQYYWIVACVTSDSTWMNLNFLEFDTQIKNQILSYHSEIEVLNGSFLMQEVSRLAMESLGTTEKEQIEYWEAKTYGQILFNGFD